MGGGGLGGSVWGGGGPGGAMRGGRGGGGAYQNRGDVPPLRGLHSCAGLGQPPNAPVESPVFVIPHKNLTVLTHLAVWGQSGNELAMQTGLRGGPTRRCGKGHSPVPFPQCARDVASDLASEACTSDMCDSSDSQSTPYDIPNDPEPGLQTTRIPQPGEPEHCIDEVTPVKRHQKRNLGASRVKRAVLIAHPYLPMAQCSEGITGAAQVQRPTATPPQHFGSLKDGGVLGGQGGGGQLGWVPGAPTYIPQHPLVAVIILCAHMWGFSEEPPGGSRSQQPGFGGWMGEVRGRVSCLAYIFGFSMKF